MAWRTAVRSLWAAATQPPRPEAGAELSSTWPPGSVVSRPRPGSAPGSSRRARAAATRRWSTGRAGARPSQTSHSSSTPTCPGGPVLKAIPCAWASASRSVSGGPDERTALPRSEVIDYPVRVGWARHVVGKVVSVAAIPPCHTPGPGPTLPRGDTSDRTRGGCRRSGHGPGGRGRRGTARRGRPLGGRGGGPAGRRRVPLLGLHPVQDDDPRREPAG